LEAADGKIGSTRTGFLAVLLSLRRREGEVWPSRFRLMQVGGGATALILGGVILGTAASRKRQETKAGIDP